MPEPKLVTIVRRKVVYEELVVTEEEFDSIQDLPFEDYCSVLSNFKDWGFGSNLMEEDTFVAFPGDVTSGTDDIICSLGQEIDWSEEIPTELHHTGIYFS